MTHDRFNAVVASISLRANLFKGQRAGWNPRLIHVGKECERIYFCRLTLEFTAGLVGGMRRPVGRGVANGKLPQSVRQGESQC